MRRFGLALLGAAWVGCGPAVPAEPGAELGIGETGFESVEDGDEVFVVFGPQGGYHIDAGVRVAGVVPGDPENLGHNRNPTTVFELAIEGETLLLDGDFTQGLDAIEDDRWTHELVGRRLLMDIGSDDEVDGLTADLTVEVQSVDGMVVSDALQVVLIPHPNNDTGGF